MDERAKEAYLNTDDDIVFDIHTAIGSHTFHHHKN